MKTSCVSLIFLLGTAGFASSQQTPAPPAPIAADAPAQAAAVADQARVFITDSASWETHSSASGASSGGTGGFAASSSGGARPQTAEIIKTFGQRCPQVIVNNHPNAVDYVVELDHEGGKGLLRKKDKVAVFVRTSADGIFSQSTLSVGGSVEGACKAVLAHWSAHASDLKLAAQAAAAPPPPPTPIPIVIQAPAAVATSGMNVNANVANCDIEVDGDFVGNTPSVVTLTPGKHVIAVKKNGYQDWTRNITVTSGTIHLNAELAAK